MAAQVANPSQQLWYAASSPTYAAPTTRMSVRNSSNFTTTTTQQRAHEEDAWAQDYVGYRFQQPDAAQPKQQPQESSGASTPESRGSSGWTSGESSADANNGGADMPAQKGNKKALRKLSRLVKKRGKDIAIVTVFNAEGQIMCSLAGAQAGQEHIYQPTPDEGKYLILALERGFRNAGCEFDFGGTTWLSGQQEEVDDKQTMLGNESTEDFRQHRFYSVLSPTGRYVVAAVLKEGNGGQLNAKLLRKLRTTADNFEVYEAWAGTGKLMAKLACAA